MIDKNEEVNILIAIANNYIREKIFKDIIEKYNKVIFPNIIDPTAKISKYAKIGKGNMIMVNAFIGANTHITNFCIINNNASIDHDCIVEKFSSLAPSVSTGGNVKIGSRSAIGIGAIIKNNISLSIMTTSTGSTTHL
jgi:UDP-3-O-[3-hydroxymyristoyl] glucosamine N-acyltransferase